MVGDTTHDLEMAAASWARSVGMTHGAHDVGALRAWSPLALFDSLPDLHRWLLPGSS